MTTNGSDKEYIKDLFPLPCEYIETTGVSDGAIFKFKTFYLKIYDDEKNNNCYRIEGYRYNEPKIVFHTVIPIHQIRSFALSFHCENYLNGYNFHFYQ